MTADVLTRSDLLESHSAAPSWFRDEVLGKCADSAWHRYPQLPDGLRDRIAAHYGVEPGNVLVTRGCTEALALTLDWLAAAADPADLLALPTPSWPGFVKLAERAGFAWSSYPVGDGPPGTGIPVVCSPNNPTGDTVAPAELTLLCSDPARPAIIDCTYDDTADVPLLPHVHRYLGGRGVFCVNLGKTTGLAGARLGLLLAHEDVVRELEPAADPFRLDLFQLAVLDTLFTERGVRAWRDTVDRARAAGARCAALLSAVLPCARVSTTLGHVVYGEYDERCHHIDTVLAATGAAIFPIERRFRVQAGAPTLRVLETLVDAR